MTQSEIHETYLTAYKWMTHFVQNTLHQRLGSEDVAGKWLCDGGCARSVEDPGLSVHLKMLSCTLRLQVAGGTTCQIVYSVHKDTKNL